MHVDWLDRPLPGLPARIAPSVSAFVADGTGAILLQHRADNRHWALPGGHVEIGESVAAAIRREVEEETGLAVRPVRIIGVYSDPANHQFASYPDGRTVHFVNVTLECRLEGGTLRGSAEGEDVRFFPADALPEPLLPPHRIRIRDALARQTEAFLR
jgi:ADP-ribose pyrophosphatase YjhB (NUDIX family)